MNTIRQSFWYNISFTHNDPFEDTESAWLRERGWDLDKCFTHNDPFEDTESLNRQFGRGQHASFTHNDPFEDTERRKRQLVSSVISRFTHNDPFEDTERLPPPATRKVSQLVSPTTIRSRILKAKT